MTLGDTKVINITLILICISNIVSEIFLPETIPTKYRNRSRKNLLSFEFFQQNSKRKKMNYQLILLYTPSTTLTNLITYFCLIVQTLFQGPLCFISELRDYNELKLEYEAYRCPVPAVSIHSTTI